MNSMVVAIATLLDSHGIILHDLFLPYPSKARCSGDARRHLRLHGCLNIHVQALDVLVYEALDAYGGVEIQHTMYSFPECRRVLGHGCGLLELQQQAQVQVILRRHVLDVKETGVAVDIPTMQGESPRRPDL